MINILISSIPLVIVGLKEDLFHNTSPRSRLFSMTISCLIFFYINPITFPVLDIPLLGALINFYPVSIIFFTFSILVVMNGMNLIDGMNGLFGFTALFLLLAISLIAFNIGDLYIMEIAILFAAPLIIFLFFNFPFGKIFIGDFGAYFYGFVIAVLTISLFSKHNYLLTWSAVLILFYPCMELLFSVIRKIKNHKSPFEPDSKHLHSLLFKKLRKSYMNSLFANSLTTLFLSIFWITPFLSSFFSPINLLITLVLSLILTVIYLFLYSLVN
jgi:UDP-GlcNAc:undecaprenyl-phosphate GlcNAc-1-phosphate transferase